MIILSRAIYECSDKQKFIDKQVFNAEKLFKKSGFNFYITDKSPSEILNKLKISILIIDFNPILNRNYLCNANYKIYEIDGHNIVPARFVSDKQEYSAATLRRKIYYNIYPFLTEFKNLKKEKVEADLELESFINNKLIAYSEFKNNPSCNVLSGLSKYLNLGFISSQRIAIEVIKSGVSDINKEAFLEELVIRKELADNFCLYAKNFNNFSNIPKWAKLSIKSHRYDVRPYIYSLKQFENADTHDILWNAAQKQLMREGVIHGYLRMYWAKKITEWTKSHDEALKIAIYLNNKYSYDSPSANGYVGILWAIAGLHDRPFTDYPITGKVRKMTYNSMKKKYKLSDYLNLNI